MVAFRGMPKILPNSKQRSGKGVPSSSTELLFLKSPLVIVHRGAGDHGDPKCGGGQAAQRGAQRCQNPGATDEAQPGMSPAARRDVRTEGSELSQELDQLMDALKSASTMLAELRTSSLSPKQYYELCAYRLAGAVIGF